jgi:hypothetical protein
MNHSKLISNIVSQANEKWSTDYASCSLEVTHGLKTTGKDEYRIVLLRRVSPGIAICEIAVQHKNLTKALTALELEWLRIR